MPESLKDGEVHDEINTLDLLCSGLQLVIGPCYHDIVTSAGLILPTTFREGSHTLLARRQQRRQSQEVCCVLMFAARTSTGKYTGVEHLDAAGCLSRSTLPA